MPATCEEWTLFALVLVQLCCGSMAVFAIILEWFKWLEKP